MLNFWAQSIALFKRSETVKIKKDPIFKTSDKLQSETKAC